jgi:hypothetical protein
VGDFVGVGVLVIVFVGFGVLVGVCGPIDGGVGDLVVELDFVEVGTVVFDGGDDN